MEATPETKEPQEVVFERTSKPDFVSYYSQEKVEPVEYVTLWEGEVSETECEFIFDETRYSLPNEISVMYDNLIDFLTQGKLYRDDPKARLQELHFDEESGKLKMIFQETSYGKTLATNRSMEIKPASWQQTIRDLLEPGPKLSELKDSKCSNHAGVNCLVITPDSYLILQEATRTKMVGAGQLGSSAAGAMDLKIPHVTPFEVMQAELFEELNLSQEETSDLELFTIARDLAAGGKPELFFILKPNLTFAEIERRKPTDPDKEVKQLIPVKVIGLNQKELDKKINDLISGNTSVSTKAALYYLSRRMSKLKLK